MSYDIKQLQQMSGKVAVVGVGETDYAEHYQAYRAARQRGERLNLDPETLAIEAFKRALADSGLKKGEIDGLAVYFRPPMDGSFERIAEIFGLKLNWGAEIGSPDHLVQMATEGIYSGRCTTVAIVYGCTQRSVGMMYYGSEARRGYMNAWYYHPWGFSSVGAQYAMAFRQHMDTFGSTEEQLATVAITFRKHAMLTDNAVIRTPLTLEDYMNSRYQCRPFHLYDYCLVNDGGVCLILRAAHMSKDLPHTPVLVAGLGRHCDYRGHTQIRFRMLEDCWNNLKAASDESFAMAGMQPSDVDHFQTYDGYSFHLPVNLEGFGFCNRGEGLEFIQGGRIGLGGELPCNTSGGMLSQSYMHGMNLHVEAVRQLRHEAGSRQVKGVETSMYCHHGHWGALTIMYRRGD